MTLKNQNKISLTHSICFMFSGKAGVGKTFCSDIMQSLADDIGLKTIKYPIATGVKNTARFMGWDGNKDKRGRILLQRIGQGGREYDEDLWIRGCLQGIDESIGYPYDVVFLDDWRFKSEIEYVKNQLLYKPIQIRVDAPNREILKYTPEYNEISEIDLDDYKQFDYPILNIYDGLDAITKVINRILLIEIKKYNAV